MPAPAGSCSGRSTRPIRTTRPSSARRCGPSWPARDAAMKGHPIFARFYGVLAALAERGELGRRRRDLLARATGTVVEVGAGTGENFKHYRPTVERVLAAEPDPTMLRLARQRAEAARVPVLLVAATGER